MRKGAVEGEINLRLSRHNHSEAAHKLARPGQSLGVRIELIRAILVVEDYLKVVGTTR